MPELERSLRELGRSVEWPSSPDVAGAVAARLGERPRRRPRRLAVALAVLAAVLAVALAVPPARSAILDLLRIGGVSVERTETLPPLSAERVAPGRRVTLAEARRAADFPLVVPRGYGAVHVDAKSGAPLVTFVWPDRLLSQFRGDERVLKQVPAQGTEVEWVQVGGSPGVWIAGPPHGLFLPGGNARLAGNVLLWVRDGVTFRLEGDLGKRRALALAGTLPRAGA